LMQIIDAARSRRRTTPVQQVPDVMQKRGGDEFIAGVFLLGQRAALQSMLELTDLLAPIIQTAVLFEQRTDVAKTQSQDVTPTVTKTS
ncbi:MAG TPA: hypothetical protein VKE42_11560, partial [Candidatus Cybelea sp.]|nr:hypothetical protein [Candidatus Cybelea sp.]